VVAAMVTVGAVVFLVGAGLVLRPLPALPSDLATRLVARGGVAGLIARCLRRLGS